MTRFPAQVFCTGVTAAALWVFAAPATAAAPPVNGEVTETPTVLPGGEVLPADVVVERSAARVADPAAPDHHGHAHDASAPVGMARVRLFPVGGSKVAGTLTFKKNGDSIEIRGLIRNLTPGMHGFHVHTYGDQQDMKEGKSAGSHFNADGEDPHGKPSDPAPQRHTGDLGNIEAGPDGVAKVMMSDKLIAFEGPNSIIGRAIVVHEKADDFGQPTGNAGGRVALGVIGIADPASAMKK